MIASFTAVYQKRAKRHVGFVEEIPGVNTQGKTLPEAKRNLKDALEMVLQANKDLAHRSHPKSAAEVDDFLARKICRDLGIPEA